MAGEGTALPGEDTTSASVPNAQHWADVYAKLASYEETLRRLRDVLGTLTGDARQAASAEALPGLLQDCEQFTQRLQFWQERLAQLTRR
jgi:hypothetical protein